MPQAGFDPPGEKWQLYLNIVVPLPPKPPRLDGSSNLQTSKIMVIKKSEKSEHFINKKM